MEKVGYAEPAVVGVFCTVDGKYDTTVDAIASALMEIFDDFKIAPAIVLDSYERLYCIKLVVNRNGLIADVRNLLRRIVGLIHVRSCYAQLPDGSFVSDERGISFSLFLFPLLYNKIYCISDFF
jgi:hypothetical protein